MVREKEKAVKILIVVENGNWALGDMIRRQLGRNLERIETTIQEGVLGIEAVLTDRGPFDVAIVCHSAFQHLFTRIIARHARTALVLFSTFDTSDQCPEGTVWFEKAGELGEEALSQAVKRAVANRTPR